MVKVGFGGKVVFLEGIGMLLFVWFIVWVDVIYVKVLFMEMLGIFY